MSYTVLCSSVAEEQFTAAFLASGDRRAVTAASRVIDEILREAPLAFGESRVMFESDSSRRLPFGSSSPNRIARS